MSDTSAPSAGVAIGATVDTDLDCRSCGYNLRTLAWGAACPECRTPTEASRLPAGISLTWRQMRQARWGLSVLVAGVVVRTMVWIQFSIACLYSMQLLKEGHRMMLRWSVRVWLYGDLGGHLLIFGAIWYLLIRCQPAVDLPRRRRAIIFGFALIGLLSRFWVLFPDATLAVLVGPMAASLIAYDLPNVLRPFEAMAIWLLLDSLGRRVALTMNRTKLVAWIAGGSAALIATGYWLRAVGSACNALLADFVPAGPTGLISWRLANAHSWAPDLESFGDWWIQHLSGIGWIILTLICLGLSKMLPDARPHRPAETSAVT